MRKPNIAVVVLDTLRKDAFDEHFDWLPGRSFENAWSTSHWTIPAHGSLFLGKYPSETGVHAKSRQLDCQEDVLAERLGSNGYRTRAFSANVNISSELNFTRGFDEFTGNWRQRAVSMGSVNWQDFVRQADDTGIKRYVKAFKNCYNSDNRTLSALSQGLAFKIRSELMNVGYFSDSGAREGLKYVDNKDFADSGEFLYVNLMETHHPYAPPRKYRNVDIPELDGLAASLRGEVASNPDDLRQAYHDSAQYLSDMYERMFSTLSEEFDYIVTLSDHGEMLGEHGVWEHLYGIYEELTHIPLIITGAGASGRTDRLTSIMDVHQTVLDWAGVEGESRGRHLLDTPSHEELLTEFHGIDQVNEESLSKKGLDPNEADTMLRGLALLPDYYGHETHEGVFLERTHTEHESPQDRLTEIIASLNIRSYDEDTEVSQSIRTHLEDLGYA